MFRFEGMVDSYTRRQQLRRRYGGSINGQAIGTVSKLCYFLQKFKERTPDPLVATKVTGFSAHILVQPFT